MGVPGNLCSNVGGCMRVLACLGVVFIGFEGGGGGGGSWGQGSAEKALCIAALGQVRCFPTCPLSLVLAPTAINHPPPAHTPAHTRRRRYPRALELLLTALTAPTMVLNAITVACLKKFMLLSLVHSGAVPPLPKHTAPLVT